MSSEIAERLSRQTRTIVSKFEERVDSFKGRQDLLLLTRSVDAADANAYAREYFGAGDHLAFGIDGSMDFDERLQMILFYANATAYSCPFHVGDKISFNLAQVKRNAKLSASAAVPLWLEDLTEVDPASVEIDLELQHSVERIPNAFMTLAELFLATKLAAEAKVIFVDRPLSGTYSTLSRDVRMLLRGGRRGLEKLNFGNVKVSMLDVKLALLVGGPLTKLPTTGRYLPFRIMRELSSGAVSIDRLAARLHAGEVEIRKALKWLSKIDDEYGGALLASSDGDSVALGEKVEGYWERCVKMAYGYAEAIFERGIHPLAPYSDDWLTILDVNTMSFLLMQHLCDTAERNRVLVIGIAKDTTASDISRAVLPFGIRENLIRLVHPRPRLNNDRAFLTLLSGMNKTLATPWRTLGYDAAFSTVVSLDEGGKGEFIPARKRVSRENLFVRGFFQLRTLGKDNRVHSPVFLFDRLFVPSDDTDTRRLEVVWKGRETIVEPYFEVGPSRTTNLVLHVLSQCDNPEVFEAMGHNQLLYLADKAVKAEIRLMKSSLRGIVNLSLGMMSKREQVTGIATPFREQRLEAERGRTRSAERN